MLRNLRGVLVSEQNLHLLREGTDGIAKPWLRDATGRFVENVDLIRLPPDIAGGLTAVAVQAALAESSVKLDAVIRGIDNLAVIIREAKIIREANRGSLQGAINALAIARQLPDNRERRAQMLMAYGQLIAEIGKATGQMRTRVSRMPSPETGSWNGWSGDCLAEAEKARATSHKASLCSPKGCAGPWVLTSNSASSMPRGMLSPKFAPGS